MCWCIRWWRSFFIEDTCTNSWLKSSFNWRICLLPSATFLSAEKLLSAASWKDHWMILGSLKVGSPFCKGNLAYFNIEICKATLPLRDEPCSCYNKSRSKMDNQNPKEGIKMLVQHRTRTILKPLPSLEWKLEEWTKCCYLKTWRVKFCEKRGSGREECCEE